MKAIIPVKAFSKRVPDKNFRPFVGQQSLFDLTVRKLRRCLPAQSIYMSCEDEDKGALAARWGINFVQRDPHLCSNETPICEVIRSVCGQISGDDDIMWCQVIDPLFDQYEECINTWTGVRNEHDSLVVVYPAPGYYLDSAMQPSGFGFGPRHLTSQMLPPMYRLTFTLSILSRAAIARTGYYVGARPKWFVASGVAVDIDTDEDFRVAALLHEGLKQEREPNGAHFVESIVASHEKTTPIGGRT